MLRFSVGLVLGLLRTVLLFYSHMSRVFLPGPSVRSRGSDLFCLKKCPQGPYSVSAVQHPCVALQLAPSSLVSQVTRVSALTCTSPI